MRFNTEGSFNLRNFQSFILGFSVFLFVYPSFAWEFVSVVTTLAASLLLLAMLIELIHQGLRLSSFVPLILFVSYNVYTAVVGVSINTDLLTTPVLATLLFFTFSKKTIYYSYFSFVRIFGYILVLSIGFYLLKLIRLYSPELELVTSADGREYYVYPFNAMSAITVGNSLYLSTGFYRFHGFMGEPGWIGTISGLVLFSLKFQFSRFKILYIYLTAALLSMSLGGYFPIFIGFVYFYFGRKLLYAIVPLSALVIFNMELFDRFILSRIAVEDGQLSGDNRTSAVFDSEWTRFINTPDVIWGKGQSQHTVFGEGVSSWKTLVYNGGVIGFFLYLSIFVAIFFTLVKSGNKKFAFIFFLVFLMTIYHRPRIQYVYFLIILYGGLLYNEMKYSKILNK